MQTKKQSLEKKVVDTFVLTVKHCHFCGSKSVKHLSSWGVLHKFRCLSCGNMLQVRESGDVADLPVETFDFTIIVYNKLKRNDINTSQDILAFLRNCRLGDDLKSDFVWKGEKLTEKNMKEIYENMKRSGYL